MFYLLFYFLIFLLHSIQTVDIIYNSSNHKICSFYENKTNNCTIYNTSLVFNSNSTIFDFDLINIKESSLTCDPSYLFTTCAFDIIKKENRNVEILNSKIFFTMINISTPNFFISNSTISTDGSVKYNPDPTCINSEIGIGYAGVGAYCQDITSECGNPYGYVDITKDIPGDYSLLMGRGAMQLQLLSDFFGAGGGRIIIDVTNFNIANNVKITSSGSPQINDEYKCKTRPDKNIINGGTGGYIYIGVEKVIVTDSSDIVILARGGNYCETPDKKIAKYAGSGGRIIINMTVNEFNNLNKYIKLISTRGGIDDSSVSVSNRNPCRNGAAGTLYFLQEDKLIIDNEDYEANSLTVVSSFLPKKQFKEIYVLNGARAGPKDRSIDGKLDSEEIYVINAYLSYERFQGLLNITAINVLSLVTNNDKSGGIGPPEQDSKSTSLFVEANKLIMNNNTNFYFGEKFYLISNNTDLIGCKIQSYFTNSELYISSKILKIVSVSMESSTIGLYTENDLTINNSNIRAFKSKCKDIKFGNYSYLNPNDYQSDFSLLYKKTKTTSSLSLLKYFIDNFYSLLILLNNKNLTFIFDIQQSSVNSDQYRMIQGANIGLFAINVSIPLGYIISSEELGCLNEQGQGKGMQDPNLGNKCGGTGGSHGGYGAFAWSNYSDILKDCLKIKNFVIYGDISNPVYEGSGGGGSQLQLNPGGKGGGVILIGAVNYLFIYGIITSSGSVPETQMGKATAGSGAGGSIQLFMMNLVGNGSIKSNGGSSQASGIGGPGGGGRIKLNFLKWYEKGDYSSNWTGEISVNRGNRSDFINQPDEIIDLGKGTISTTPCLPGYEGEVCKPCKVGTYKSIIGVGKCFECTNKPDLSFSYYTKYGEITPQCAYECKNTISSDLNPACYPEFYFYTTKLGGYPGIVGIMITLFFIFIIIAVRFFRKKKVEFKDSMEKNQDINNLSEKGQLHTKELAKLDFCMDDMPYHLKRIYLIGENNCEKAWYLNNNDYLDINNNEINVIQCSDFLKTVNSKLKYSPLIRIIVLLFNWTYYPIYYLVIYLLRKQKYQKMIDLLPNLNILYSKQKSYSQDESITPLYLKFSSTTDYTLGYIDILNYSKTLLEWSSVKFPVCLILAGEGSFLFPLYLDITDPFIKTLCSSINEERGEENEMWINATRELRLAHRENQLETKLKKKKIGFQEFLKNFNEKTRRIDFWSSFEDFKKDLIDLMEYIEKSNKEFFKSRGITAQLFLHKIGESSSNNSNEENLETSIIFLDLATKNYLEEHLKEAHICKHKNNDFNIKFSLNLMKNEENNRPFSIQTKSEDMQIKGIGINNEESKEKEIIDELEILKKQLIMKNENQKDEENKKNEIFSNKWINLKKDWKEIFRNLFYSIQRTFGWIRASLLKFRSSKENSSFLPIALFILLIFDLGVFLVLIFFCINGDKYLSGIFYVFPFSVFISTILFFIWFGCYSNNVLLGKVFLIYNCQSMINLIVGFIVSISVDEKKVLTIISNLLFSILKYAILYCGSKYLSLK